MTTRTPLRRDLSDLKQKVYLLGEKCIEISDFYNSMLEDYSTTLDNRLKNLSDEVRKESKELNDQCFLVLTLQQPLIKDLRFVIGSLQIVLNLEKITEQYTSTLSLITDVNILEISIKEKLIKMARNVQELLRLALTLYLSSNADFSHNIERIFPEINYLHDFLYKQILNKVGEEAGQKAQIEAQLLAIIRTLEKIANLILNTVEQVNYIIIGKSEINL